MVYIPFINGSKNRLRIFSIVATYIFVYGSIILIVTFIIPELIKSVTNFTNNLTKLELNATSITNADNFIKNNLDSINESYNIGFTYENAVKMFTDFISVIVNFIPQFTTNLISGTLNMANVIYNFVIGTIVAFYLLMDKDKISALSFKILYSFMSKRNSLLTISAVKSSNTILQEYTMGKILDSIIIGIIFYVVCLIFKFPYPLLLGIIIGTTNIIPFFGPFIGAIPTVLIVFMDTILDNPQQSLWVILAIVFIQQLDGNIIGPKILGDSIGLRPIAIIFSIIVGGAVFGIPGMFFGPPIFAVMKNAFMYYLEIRYDRALKD
jgi:predicted PurR-regulated permease PerM